MNHLTSFRFEIVAEDGAARAGIIHTPHGDIMTPTFTVVGTHGYVKFLPPDVLAGLGTQAMLCNGYHLFRHADRVEKDGGLAAAFGWNGPTITDSGGFQAMSLGSGLGKVISMDRDDIADPRRPAPVSERLARVSDEGVLFRHPSDGRLDLFTPEVSIKAQFQLGADIIMAFDELTSIGDSYAYNVQALERTERWAERSLAMIRQLQAEAVGVVSVTDADRVERLLANFRVGREGAGSGATTRPTLFAGSTAQKSYQALYGILQGAHYRDLRQATARNLGAMDFDGYGLGGAFEKEQLGDILNWTNTILPSHKPRHLLGLARPDDIFVGVTRGIDTFDCVSPTREARHGRLYTVDGHINVMRSRYTDDPNPIDPTCDCPTCAGEIAAQARNDGTGQGRNDGTGQAHNDGTGQARKDKLLASSQTDLRRGQNGSGGASISRGEIRHLLKSQSQADRQRGYQYTSAHNVRFILRLMENIRANITQGTLAEFQADFLAKYYGQP